MASASSEKRGTAWAWARGWGRLRYLYPLAFAVWPALSLYATNIDHYRLGVLVRPVLASTAVAVLLQGALLGALRQPAAAALKAFLALVAFFAGGQLCFRWRGYGLAGVPFELSLIPAVLTVGLVLLALVARPPRRFDRLPEVLWVFSLALLSMPLTTVIRVELVRARMSVPRVVPLDLGRPSDTHPHVFYLVLDGYGREDVLRDLYGHDNRPFLNALRERGCYVASGALANYPLTAHSLASSLNMDYLDEWTADWTEPLDPAGSDRRIFTKAVNESRVAAALRSSGYSFVAFATGYEAAEARSADRFISLSNLRLFWEGFYSTTPLYDLLPAGGRSLTAHEQHRREVLHTFEGVGPLAASKGPLFVLAHVLIPHPPFVFDATGALPPTRGVGFSLSDGVWWRAATKQDGAHYRRAYVDQLQYVNSKTLEAFDAIRRSARRPVVVVIQGDHGPGSELDYYSAERTNLRERLGILNVYCFPGRDYSELYPSISPVNSFRVVLGRVRGRPIPLLPDRSYFVTLQAPYRYLLLRPESEGGLRLAVSPS